MAGMDPPSTLLDEDDVNDELVMAGIDPPSALLAEVEVLEDSGSSPE